MDKKNQGETDTEAEIAAEGAGEKELSFRYENRRQVAKGGILGFFIGLAVIVPGVSGSAVAIIFKLYEKLPYALGSFFRKFKTSMTFATPVQLSCCPTVRISRESKVGLGHSTITITVDTYAHPSMPQVSEEAHPRSKIRSLLQLEFKSPTKEKKP